MRSVGFFLDGRQPPTLRRTLHLRLVDARRFLRPLSVFHVRERNVARLNDLPEPLRLKGEFSTRARSLLLSVGAFLQPERNLSGEDGEKKKRRRGQHASP